MVGRREPIDSMKGQFIEALFEFEEQLREQPVTVDDDLPFLPYRRGGVAKVSGPVIMVTVDVDADPDDLEGA